MDRVLAVEAVAPEGGAVTQDWLVVVGLVLILILHLIEMRRPRRRVPSFTHLTPPRVKGKWPSLDLARVMQSETFGEMMVDTAKKIPEDWTSPMATAFRNMTQEQWDALGQQALKEIRCKTPQ